jgi:polysaccharide export outer membrane protein
MSFKMTRANQLKRAPPGRALVLIQSACLVGLALTVVSCAPGSNLAPLPNQHEMATSYKLGSGDSIRIITFGEDQLTGEFRVSDNGTIALPLLGIVPVAGLSVEETGKDIAKRLEKGNIYKNPSVSVEISNYRPIFILGEVNKPGQYPYQPGMTLLSTVSIAGGFTYRAVDQYASVIRNVDKHVIEGKVDRQAQILPNDVVTVFERRF